MFRDAVDALCTEIRGLLGGALKGRRTGVSDLRKKMEAQSDVPVSCGYRIGVSVQQLYLSS